MSNTKLSTGEVEIVVNEIEILSAAKTPPIAVADDNTETQEELRLKYRYLDIRRGLIAKNLILRHEAMQTIRKFLSDQKFIEISTPILGKSTPEGARDYLVPSRLYTGNFYALPQSPQIFKQLLMVSGMDRYFQIATCFRDEDLRADRQPEFSQVDIEMSFGYPEDLMKIIEGLIATVFQGKSVPKPFPRMSYFDAMEYYGTDRPDLRFGMALTRLDDIAKQSTFSVFLNELNSGGCIKAICIKGGATLSRKDVDGLTGFVSQFGLKGLSWIKLQEEGISSSVGKFFTDELMKEIFSRTDTEKGDLILIAAGPQATVNQGLDHLRRHIAKTRNLIPDTLSFLWVTDFPLMRWNADENRIEAEHHPFTAPNPEDLSYLDSDPLKVRALAYDLVLNGYEIGGGSQRIHSGDLQEKIFQILKLSPDEITQKFGFFVEALKYGTPPHLGIALGLDRIVMILAKTDNIRDVIAFPKTQKASDLMMQAPSPVSSHQLTELDIKANPCDIHWI
jgi:aspartyl-tRNA synthetase